MTILSRLFSQGFRIFFFAACIFAMLSMVVRQGWPDIDAAGGMADLPRAFDPQLWYAHEMIFGYGAAVLAGWILASMPNRAKGKSAPQLFVVVAFVLWLAGRFVLWFSASLPPSFVALVDLAFMPVLATKIAFRLLVRPKPIQIMFLLVLSLLWTANLLCHLEWSGLMREGMGEGIMMGLMTQVAMVLVLGGRVIPGITHNAKVATGREVGLPRNLTALTFATNAAALALIVVFMPFVNAILAVMAFLGLSIFVGVAAFAQVALWQGWRTRHRPILWTLHLSYAFAGLGLIAFDLSAFEIGSQEAAVDLLLLGAVGGMTLSVMSRESLRCSGRPLDASPALAGAFVLLPLAALASFTAWTFPALNFPARLLSGALWTAAFTLALVSLWPAFFLPRLAGDPLL